MKKESQSVTNAILAEQLKNLAEAIKEGFSGVHERQDKTNGKVLKAGEDIIQIQKENVARDVKFKYNRLIWYLFTISVSLIIALGSYILFHH